MTANRLREYKTRFSTTNQFIASSHGQPSNPKEQKIQRATMQAYVEAKTGFSFDPSQFDAPVDLGGLPGLKPSAVVVEVRGNNHLGYLCDR